MFSLKQNPTRSLNTYEQWKGVSHSGSFIICPKSNVDCLPNAVLPEGQDTQGGRSSHLNQFPSKISMDRILSLKFAQRPPHGLFRTWIIMEYRIFLMTSLAVQLYSKTETTCYYIFPQITWNCSIFYPLQRCTLQMVPLVSRLSFIVEFSSPLVHSPRVLVLAWLMWRLWLQSVWNSTH